MTKTLNQFLEGYLKVKSSDEQKFVDKHVAVKNPDRNGNGDDVFNGNTKTINRRKTRKGYDAGDDAKVYEEAELVDEGNAVNKLKKREFTATVGAKYKKLGFDGRGSKGRHPGLDSENTKKDNIGLGRKVLTKEEADLEESKHIPARVWVSNNIVRSEDKNGNVKSHGKRSGSLTNKVDARALAKKHGLEDTSKDGRVHFGPSNVRSSANPVKEEADLEEKAPPGAKYERMVKDIKKGYSKGGVTAREKSIAYATAWKAKKANEETEQVDEGNAENKLKKNIYTVKRGIQDSGAWPEKGFARTRDEKKAYVKNALRWGRKTLAKEEAEQIDELSVKTVDSYREKAFAQQPAGDDGSKLYKKRKAGRDMAFMKVTRGAKVMAKEEAEQIDEISLDKAYAYKNKAGDYIDASNAMAQGGHKLSARRRLGDKKRDKGLETAHAKIGGYAKVNAKEETLVDILSGLKESHIRTMVEVYESLSEENQAKFVATCKKDGGIDAMLNFAIKNRGE